MNALLSNGMLQRVAATLGVVGTVGAGAFLVLASKLVVPTAWTNIFAVGWVVLLILSIAWWRAHPWRTLLVPVLGIALEIATVWLGSELFGWTA